MKLYVRTACAIAVAGTIGTARATEFGQSHADLGYIDTLAGLPLAPGWYVRDDVNVQVSGRVNDQNGNQVNLNLGPATIGAKFRNTIEADILSAAFVPDWKVPTINATIGVAAYGSVVNSRAGFSTRLGIPQRGANSKAGFGDLTVVPVFLGFDVPGSDFHFVFSPLEFTAPTGRYSRSDPIGNNIGTNYWSYRPALEMTYLNKTGQEFSVNMSAAINTRNEATKYRSGDEFYFTWVGQQHLSETFALGIGGYYYKQTGDDRQNGVIVNTTPLASGLFDPLNGGPGNKGETFAIGPVISYDLSHDLVFQAHWDHEVFAYNRPQKDQVYVRGVVRF